MVGRILGDQTRRQFGWQGTLADANEGLKAVYMYYANNL